MPPPIRLVHVIRITMTNITSSGTHRCKMTRHSLDITLEGDTLYVVVVVGGGRDVSVVGWLGSGSG